MQGKVESGSVVASPGGLLALGLALQRGRAVLNPSALLAALPFLALSGRFQSRAQATVRGRGRPHAMPWPAPRWFGWSVRDAPPAPTGESGPRLPGRASATESRPSAHPSPAQRMETLAALAPALRWADRRSGVSPHVRPAVPVLGWQALARLGPARSGPGNSNSAQSGPVGRVSYPPSGGQVSKPALRVGVPISTRQHLGSSRAQGWSYPAEIPDSGVDAATEAGVGQHEIGAPSAVDGPPPHLTGVVPAWGLSHTLPGLAPGAAPTGLPATRTQRPTLPRQPALEASASIPRETLSPGLPWPRLQQGGAAEPQVRLGVPRNLQGPGPYAATPLQTLAVVADEVKHLVKRQVTKEVHRRQEEMQAQVSGPARVGSGPTPIEIASDEVARRLLHRLQALTQEERFRQGLLR